MIPMAGLGARFAREGYKEPKPLVAVDGRPMVAAAAGDLPDAPRRVFVLRKDLPERARIESAIATAFENAAFVTLDATTDGQARTCLLGLGAVDEGAPLTIGACDNGVVYDSAAFSALMEDEGADVIVWGFRGHPNAARRPEMYGWIDVQGNRVARVSVKRPLADPKRDPIVIGAFTFKRAGDFRRAAEAMIARDGRVNGEFYVDECVNDAIAQGLKVRLFETDAYLCWGTPDELKTFEYWRECFSRWPGHPYRAASA